MHELPPFTLRRARAVTAAVGCVAIALAGLGLAAPANAAPANGAPPSEAATTTPPTRADEHTVTLITGDRVHVTTLPGGERVVDVETAVPGAGYRTLTVDDELLVLPDGVEEYLAAGLVDRDLFNVSRLIEYGYDDARVDATPVILELATGPSTFAAEEPVPGIEVGIPLESIGGAAAQAAHDDAAATWSALTHADGPTPFGAGPALGGGIEAIHLDGKVEATLDSSVPWTGAPEAWAQGFTGDGVTVAVLDTGYDDTHPDLAGRVLPDSASFVPGEEVAWDPNGHGTHVASTIAGTGAAGGGAQRGVADGADLLVGKILDATGEGQDSWVIAGMEWAAERAPIVSMSIGSMSPSDGADVMDEALNRIAEQTGALFVVAAGNFGAPETIGSPGAAREAFTVASVDDPSGSLSWFSSQGPLTRSGVLKPDIAGPGNDVTAARSADSAGEGPYIAMSGTSMATPHVSGAAAIVKQQHPDYTAAQLRAVLASSAKDLGLTSYQAGAGGLDVAAAVDATVVAAGSGDFGLLSWGEDASPIERTIEYTNRGAAEVTVDLAPTLQDSTPGGGGGDSAGALTLETTTLTIPAGETRSVTVTADPSAVAPGTQHTGALVASIGGAAVARTALGLLVESERYDLTLTATGFHGEPVDTIAVVYNADTGDYDFVWVSGERTVRLPKGRWSVSTYAEIAREADTMTSVFLGDPDVMLDSDQTVALDARTAEQVSVDVGKTGLEQLVRRMDSSVIGFENGMLVATWVDELWAQPQEASDAVAFDFTTRWRLVHDRLTVTVGKHRLDVIPQAGATPFEGDLKATVVDAGIGTPEALAAAGVAGRIAFATLSPELTPTQQTANAAAAGAVMLLLANDADSEFSTWVGAEDFTSLAPIPVAGISGVQGGVIRQEIARHPAKATVHGEPYSSEVWDLARYATDAVPQDLRYRPGDLARVDTTFYGHKGDLVGELRWDRKPTGSYGFGLPVTTQRGMERTDWIDPSLDWYQQAFTVHGGWEVRDVPRSYEPGQHTETSYFGPIVRPFVGEGFWAPARVSAGLSINIPAWGDGGDIRHTGTMDVFSPEPTASISTDLYLDGQLVKTSPFPDTNYWETPDGTSDVRVVTTATHDGSVLPSSTKTVSDWTFRTTGTADDWSNRFLPMLQAWYDVDLDATGLAGAGRKKGAGVPLALEVGHVAGAEDSAPVTTTKLEVRVAGGQWATVPLELESRDTSGPGEAPDGIFAEGRAYVAAYSAQLTAPDAGGWLDLRVTTADEAGNTLTQEIERALEIAPAKGAKPRR
ncbi:S8 family serine peptidase [Microbacterium sp. BK668]|uniref:S8 family serine peptidase n=1 Tax=Microbacterium sp. BK668 TaxID=2512118 RepID=UPI00105C77BF|nr:S8 family serine peptidase [Microbacterium sp. BK668]TDN87768.1 subtilisin family serine protease [Microbacterium sp. BK668]